MIRGRFVRPILSAVAGLVLLLIVAAGLWSIGKLELGSRFDERQSELQTEFQYRSVEIDPEISHQLVVFDYPWPHEDPIGDPDRFRGESPVLWRDTLSQAAAAFQNVYPNVDIVFEELSFADDWRQAERLPDILALWWDSPTPDAGQVVPIGPYLNDEIRAEYHPLSWKLQEQEGKAQGWPRWVAGHYWLAPGLSENTSDDIDENGLAWYSVLTEGWTLQEVGEYVGPDGRILAPPASPGLWLELLASNSAGGSGPSSVEMLQQIKPWLPGSDELANQLGNQVISRQFTLAGGLGPAFSHWAVSAPRSRRSDVIPSDLVLLPPPMGSAPATRVPVFSYGSYVVLRKDGSAELQRAQAAMAFAQHLSRWSPEAPISRLLAFPAYRSGIQRWHAADAVSEAVRKRLLDDAAHAISMGERVYGAQAPTSRQLDPTLVRELYAQWLDDRISTAEAVDKLTIGPGQLNEEAGRN